MTLKSKEYSILDLNNLLFEKKRQNIEDYEAGRNDLKIEELKSTVEFQKESNKKTKSRINYLKNKLVSKGRSMKKDDIEDVEKTIRSLNKQVYNVDISKNKINELSGKDYYILIQNNFVDEKIKVSELLKKENPAAYILSSLEKDVLDANIKNSKSGVDVKKKLLAKIEENKKLIAKGLTEYPNEEKIIYGKGVRRIKKNETNPPILIDFVNNSNIIAINV